MKGAIYGGWDGMGRDGMGRDGMEGSLEVVRTQIFSMLLIQ